MTRETKAGLVVSCSFFCLVVTVFVCKWREKSAADKQVAAEEAGAPAAPEEPKKVVEHDVTKKAPATISGTSVQQQDNKQSPASDPLKLAGLPWKNDQDSASHVGSKADPKSVEKKNVVANNGSPLIPQGQQAGSSPSAGSSWDGFAVGISVKDNDSAKSTPAVVVVPAPAIDLSKPTLNAGVGLSVSTVPKADALGKSSLSVGADLTLAPKNGKAESVSTQGGQDRPRVKIPDPPASLLLNTQSVATTPPGKERDPKSLPVDSFAGPAMTSPDKNNNWATVAPSASDRDSAIPGKSPTNSSPEDRFQPPFPGLWSANGAAGGGSNGGSSGSSGALTPSIGDPMRGSQVSPSSGQTRAGVNLSGTSIKNANSDRMATPPDAVVQVPLDPLKNAMESRATPGQTTPPLGSSIKPATPALVAQAPADDSVQSTAPGSSQVESYDEETYQCKANDSFRNISLAYYHTDKYERALQLFNRNHPLAADALKQDAVTLQSGLNVYIPPKRILDKYYVDMVGAVPAVGSTTTPPVPQKSASASAPAAPSADERERTYRVKDGGEMFRDIARTTLGDPERWAEIYRLNPRFDPAEPIPAGTELRVPNQARADARPTP